MSKINNNTHVFSTNFIEKQETFKRKHLKDAANYVH